MLGRSRTFVSSIGVLSSTGVCPRTQMFLSSSGERESAERDSLAE